MSQILLFLGSVFVISFSGAAAPGPVTATTITLGTKTKYAGSLIAIGHLIIEVPLILLVVSGIGTFLNTPAMKIAIGTAGGAVLLWMGYGMFKNAANPEYTTENALVKSPVTAGIILSASNPYFLLWWLTIGVKFASDAIAITWFLLPAFIFVHWLADLIWFQFLSSAGNKGARVMSKRNLKIVLSICAAALVAFGIYFLFDAARIIHSSISPASAS
mgnify:CR=1 FL=1